MTGLYVASNPTALSAQFNLTRNMGDLSNVLTRLSTGLKINSGKDDPAGLIASELLKADITGTTKAITNTERANSMIATADSSLGQISNLLNDVKGLVVEAANTGAMSADQIAANQLQVDASLESIDRIARSTTYAGQKLLDGSLDFRTNICGGTNGQISNLQITSANFGNADSINVDVQVQEAAKKGTLIYNGTGVDQRTTIDVTGSVGTKSFTFGAGTTNDQMATAINAASDSTGVAARVEGKASRGSVILSSSGQNNDIVITANSEGKDAGNYTFRIVHGPASDARIVSAPDAASPGVVEISVVDSFDKTYNKFAGMFNVTIDGQYAVDNKLTASDPQDPTADPLTAAQAETSVTMMRGNANAVQFFQQASAATGTTESGKTLTVTTVAENDHMSSYNGWSVIVDDAVSADLENGQIDVDNKTIKINSANATTDNLAVALDAALGQGSVDGGTELTLSGAALVSGDKLTFGNGGDAGELFVTYKEGATAGEIQKMINSAPYVQATLASGVTSSTLVPNLPNGSMHVETKQEDITAPTDINSANPYVSGTTSQQVIDIINSKLGDKFTAVALSGDGTNGRVSYTDASVISGSVNKDNALRFTGMDNGPIVRMVTGGSNKELGLSIVYPSEADTANGIHTPVLQIQLATDASGNSISSAADVAALFDSLTPAETLGVSAEVLYPDGVDPNGRVWVDDGCGNMVEVDNCPAKYGLGIVDPTGVPGTCEIQQNDLVMLGNNEGIVATKAVARIANADLSGMNALTPGAAAPANAVSGGDATRGDEGTTLLEFYQTSAMNGVSFAFTLDAKKTGFDQSTGTLVTYIDPTSANLEDEDLANAALESLVNGAIAANWESIRNYTGATGGPVKLATEATIPAGESTPEMSTALEDAALYDAGTGGFTKIPPSVGAKTTDTGTLGVGENDPVLLIKAKQAGVDMAGVTIHFVQDDSLTAYTMEDYTAGWADGDPTAMDVAVEFQQNDDGTKALIVRGNLGVDAAGNKIHSVNAMVLANSLTSNAEFQKYFTAETPLGLIPEDDAVGPLPTDALGTVAFSSDVNKVAAITSGGYEVSSNLNCTPGASTSSGVAMTGASDSSERLILEATEYGSQNFVKVATAEGSFDTYCPLGLQTCYLAGTDVVATINGNAATGNGTKISINTADLAMSMDVANQVGGSNFNIQGGGALFQLGPDVVSAQQMRVGIGSMLTTQLGGVSGKMFQLKTGGQADLLTSDNSRKMADRIVGEAINFVATTRGRLGAIQKSSLDPNISMLQDSLVALTAAEASYSNADFAEESSNMTRLQLLVQAGMSTLGIANQFPQYAASLVR